MDPDAMLRAACFRRLDSLRARFGEDLPAKEALAPGFEFDGERTPFRNVQAGIYRSRRQRGPAALSILTAPASPYDADEVTDDGFWYAYRRGSIDQADNRALRAAATEAAPLVYFVGTGPGLYRAVYPCYVTEDDPRTRRVRVEVGGLRFGEPSLSHDEIERRYALRQARVRLHQGRFRGVVLPAYRDRCAICSLHDTRLLDAAHIVGDGEVAGVASVQNGLSLCTIHHRAFDHNLVGVDPDYRVHVADQLLLEKDGPMLELLKTFHRAPINAPRRADQRPNRELLEARFERFLAA